MSTNNQKIGQLISQIRQERGLTQSEFAKRLGTSQSAINRIEQGKQNLSLETISRISSALGRDIVTINPKSLGFEINGGKELHGEITMKTSKNASVALLAASLLNKGTTYLEQVPKIEEVARLIEVLESIGVQVRWVKDTDLEIKPPETFELKNINVESAKKTRSIIMFIGSLMHHLDSFSLPYAGGCHLGKRTIAAHQFALEEFGVTINTVTGEYQISVDKKLPGSITMYEPSDTGTENILLAAALTPGKTTIRFAASNYMVQDVCLFLQKLGVKIEGIGTSTLVVHGISGPVNKRVKYAPSEDPLEAMLFITVAAVTNSSIVLRRCPIDFLELELLKLKKMGLTFTLSDVYLAKNGHTRLIDITTHHHDGLTALDDKIHALPYPGINMDNLPFFAPIAAIANGETLIHDWSYEDRALYFTELNKLNARVRLLDPHRVMIDGPTKFKPAEVICPPALRPATIILAAMLAAPGKSVLRNVYSINRGYESLAERLRELGADIKTLHDL
ncbi:MAG: UDP-N-acetylglucosamine 1-carboxyvinyltransferase [Candidatus Saccharimonadales bacterium]